MALDTAPNTTVMMSPAPSAEVTYALASSGVASFLECLPNIEMKDAPSVDIAQCMLNEIIPDEGIGAEVRQRAAALANEAEIEIRLRYAEEITARAAVRLGRITNSSSRKRSLDDLDLYEALQELENADSLNLRGNNNNNGGGQQSSDNENIDHKQEEQKRKYEEELRGPQRSNVVPFKRPSTAAVIVASAVNNTPSI
jgi:hypothetical protein